MQTLSAQATIAQAQAQLQQSNSDYLIVLPASTEDPKERSPLLGIITQRDVDLALHYGFAIAPVANHCRQNIQVVTSEISPAEQAKVFAQQGVDYLVIVAGEQLVEVVQRSQRLDNQPPADFPEPATRMAPATWELLQQLTQAAQMRGWQLYLVGGVVRDLFLAAQTCDPLKSEGSAPQTNILQGQGDPAPTPGQWRDQLRFKDIDLVVDGVDTPSHAGVELAEAIYPLYPAAKLTIHGTFQTAALTWDNDPELGNLGIDIATARTEVYPYPAANPVVSASSIRQDLQRRDFTINAMAFRLTEPNLIGNPLYLHPEAQIPQGRETQPLPQAHSSGFAFGLGITEPNAGVLLDFFGGIAAARSRQIRAIHPNSFIEDPTRIFRAVRFAVRLGFEVEPETVGWIRNAIASGIYEQVRSRHPQAPALTTRLQAELQTLFTVPYWQAAVELLQALRAWRCLHPELRVTADLLRQLRRLRRGLRRFAPEQNLTPWQLCLELLLSTLPRDEAIALTTALHLPPASGERLGQLSTVLREMNHWPPDLTPSAIAARLKPHSPELLILCLVQLPRPQRRLLWRYLSHWSQLRPPLNGHDLQQLGYSRGPQYRMLLDDLLNARLDGKIATREEAIVYLAQHHPLEGT